MNYSWTKGCLIHLSVSVAYHVIEKLDSGSEYMMCLVDVRPSLHSIHQTGHLSLFQILIIS